ncbi:MAG: hypothetical protein ABI887_07030 [Burkholderiales bacterium]
MWPIEGSRRRIAIAVVAVLALHAALIVALSRSRTMSRSVTPTQRVTLRLIPPSVPRAAEAARPPAASLAAHVTPPRNTTPTRPNEPRDTPTASTASAAITPPEPAASTPEVQPSLMDTDATRRAIRASARTPLLSDQLAQSRDEPARQSAADRLAHGVRDAGKGDCAKGEYAGAGMGLLSLPFLAAAALAGNCAK